VLPFSQPFDYSRHEFTNAAKREIFGGKL